MPAVGSSIVFADRDPNTGWDDRVLPLDDDRRPAPLARTPSHETGVVFSSDARWIACVPDETSRPEADVQPARAPGKKRRIATAGRICSTAPGMVD